MIEILMNAAGFALLCLILWVSSLHAEKKRATETIMVLEGKLARSQEILRDFIQLVNAHNEKVGRPTYELDHCVHGNFPRRDSRFTEKPSDQNPTSTEQQ